MTALVATLPDDRPPIPPEWLVAAHAAAPMRMTWASLARRLQVTEGTVYKWRTGRSPIVRVVWLGILATLGLPMEWQPPKPS